MGSKGKHYRTVEVEGFEVLIGKGDEENDELTFEIASPHDFWLHAAHVSGSHVVVRNPDSLGEIPPSVMERAAELAAWYSRARRAKEVDVHVCRVADVTKPARFPPGKVLLRRWTALRVVPRGAS